MTENLSTSHRRILLTGATGYIGGRLLLKLESSDYGVRCLARRPENLRGRVHDDTEVVQGDVLDRESLDAAFDGVDTAYYLVHSMASSGSFEDQDRKASQNFADAAKQAGVRRIIYLGGLGDDSEQLSPHLRSRHEVGEVLRKSGCDVIEFRASIVIGSGSLSFELVRALVQRLPLMICPRWVSVQTQPIAVEDLQEYLLQAIEYEGEQNQIFEIGGPDQVSYEDIMREFARQRGLMRMFISVPVLTPKLSSLWLGLVTPVYARIGRKLIDSLRNPTVVKDSRATKEFSVKPRGLSKAIARALIHEDREVAETRWSDALSSAGGVRTWAGVRFGNRMVDSRTTVVHAAPEQAFTPIRQIGGAKGWYYADFLWTLRGWIDLLFGGIGRRRGRRDPDHLRVGDVLDWWRVEKYKSNHCLRLAAEMKVPGRAWLEFEVTPLEDATDNKGPRSEIRQTAIFDPIGLFGVVYWYALFPIHSVLFRSMLARIAMHAEQSGDQMVTPVASN